MHRGSAQVENPSNPGSGIISGLQASGRISTSVGWSTTLMAACFTSCVSWGAYGQKGVVSSIRTVVRPGSITISRMSPRSTTESWISGSITVSSAARTPEQLERAQRALRDSQNPAMQMLESLDEQAALAGVSTGRRLQTRRIMSEAVWRLRNQPPALVIRETLGKVDKVSASDVSLEARRDLVASRAGEKLFWDQQQRQTGVGPGGPAADSTSTAERHDRGNLAGRGAKTMGIGILVGGVAAAGAAAGAFPLVFVVTAGALMFLIGLIMLLIGIGTDSTPQTSER